MKNCRQKWERSIISPHVSTFQFQQLLTHGQSCLLALPEWFLETDHITDDIWYVWMKYAWEWLFKP